MFLTGGRVAGVLGIPRARVQPAGVDLSVAEVRRLDGPGELGNSGRSIPAGIPVEPVSGWWSLDPGVYRIRFAEVVRIPKSMVGFCYPRSSLVRMGVLVGCAVWDPGYVGRGEAMLAVFNPWGVRLEVGVGVAQLVLARLEGEAEAGYSGYYQGEGLHGEE